MDQFGADARQKSRVRQFRFKLRLRAIQRFISPATLDKIRRLASIQIQTMQFSLARSMYGPEVRRNHTQRLAAATHERRGYYRAVTGRADNVKHGREERVQFDIFNDDSFT